MTAAPTATWHNWARTESAAPTRVTSPVDTAAVVREVLAARERGGTVKMIGSGHSFTGIAVAPDAQLRPDALSGILAVDRDAMTVTAAAGTPLRELNARLAGLGLSLHNMGDIDAQTVAGAISTGTHGTGGVVASLAAQVAALELVSGTGEVLRASADEHPDVFAAGPGRARGAGGPDLDHVPGRAALRPRGPRAADVLGRGAVVVRRAGRGAPPRRHVLVPPHRPDDDQDQRPARRPRRRASRSPAGAAGWTTSCSPTRSSAPSPRSPPGPRVPPRCINRVSARALSERRYSDIAHRVFTTPAPGPLQGDGVRRPARGRSRRAARGAPRGGRLRLAGQLPRRDPHGARRRHHPLDGIGARLALPRLPRARRGRPPRLLRRGRGRAHAPQSGRPHWGKMHTRSAADLASVYPRWDEFAQLRDRLDPDRVLTNAHLQRVLG